MGVQVVVNQYVEPPKQPLVCRCVWIGGRINCRMNEDQFRHADRLARKTHSHEEMKFGNLPIGLYVFGLGWTSRSIRCTQEREVKIEVRCFVD